MMDLLNSFLNLAVPPVSLVMMAFAWPSLCFLRACERLYTTMYGEDMEGKVVVITGASSGIGEQIAYEYAKRGANLALVARREQRLHGIRENCRLLGARQVISMGADVIKEEDCTRFIKEIVTYFGHLDHLVNTTSLGHTFLFEEASDTSVFPHMMDINFWGNVYPTYAALPYLRQSHGRIVVNAAVESWLPMPRMSLYAAAKAAVINFYQTLRFEVRDEVKITVATHGWIGMEQSRGRFMMEEGTEMQWKEENEVPVTEGHVMEYAKLIVDGACRGESEVKYPSWYDVFLLYRVLVPDILGWTFGLLFSSLSTTRKTSLMGTGLPRLEGTSPRRSQHAPSFTKSPRASQHAPSFTKSPRD